MATTSSTSSSEPRVGPRERIPRAALAALAVIATVEFGVWRVPEVSEYVGRFAGVANTTDPLRLRGALRRRPPNGRVVAFLGTSQVARGVDAEAVRAGSGDRIALVNLGISGGAPSDLLWLERRLDRVGPRVVLVSFLETQMNDPPKAELVDASVALAIARHEGWRLFDRGADVEVLRTNLRQGSLFELLPTLRVRRGLPSAVAAWARAARRQRTLTPAAPDLWRQGARDERTMATILAAGPVRASVNRWWKLQWWAADRVLARLRADGYQVYYVRMPRHPDFSRTLSPEAAADFERRLADVLGRHGIDELTVDAAFGPDDFYDFVHFTAAGRAKFSAALGARLAELP